MKTRNAMQLKARIKARAKAADVSPQLMLQDYLLERLLERISLSPWRDAIIVKGGMLISSFIGIDSRVTKDLDTTIRGFDLNHESAASVFKDICAIEVDDDIRFEFLRTEDIRETDDYPSIRIFLKAHYEPMAVPLSVDVTTGDAITPGPIEYRYSLIFDDKVITLMAYPIETVVAEKLETVISRGVSNTRPRDYYDIWKIWNLHGKDIDIEQLANALAATSAKSGRMEQIAQYHSCMKMVSDDRVMQSIWRGYSSNYSYARNLGLEDACRMVVAIMDRLSPSS